MKTKAAVAFERAIEGMTHEAVEERLGLATRSGQITRLANGERKPGRELAYRIEVEFGVPMSGWEIPARGAA